jgi:hypothetical protein
MRRLGYERYGAQGGDWGSGISRHLGIVAPEHVVGVHVNTLSLTREEDPILSVGGPAENAADDFTDVEKKRLEARARFIREGAGYGMIQSTRPQTLSYALLHPPPPMTARPGPKIALRRPRRGRPAPRLFTLAGRPPGGGHGDFAVLRSPHPA